jgi:hypothetical protein
MLLLLILATNILGTGCPNAALRVRSGRPVAIYQNAAGMADLDSSGHKTDGSHRSDEPRRAAEGLRDKSGCRDEQEDSGQEQEALGSLFVSVYGAVRQNAFDPVLLRLTR